ncbi:MAG: hypothetical protein OXL34_16910 [Gemmatimonadota bacterium]|nr:hypothetical protein [Gemmatimonadota bacterium]
MRTDSPGAPSGGIIKDLLQLTLTDGRLSEEVAEGIRLIVEHAERERGTE